MIKSLTKKLTNEDLEENFEGVYTEVKSTLKQKSTEGLKKGKKEVKFNEEQAELKLVL